MQTVIGGGHDMIDVERARIDTPGCTEVIHLNNAGAGLMPSGVLDAVIGHLKLEAQIGGYEAAAQAVALTEGAYDSIAKLIGCSRDEVAIVENATRAWDMAFYSIPLAPGDRILTSVSEYGSNYVAFLQAARRTGATIDVIPNDDHGQTSARALRGMIDGRVKLIAITHVPTNGGLVNPAAEIGQVARDAGILYLLDACQSVGQMPVDVREIGCDMLSATGRKYLRGPRGTGFLYVRGDLIEQLEPPFVDIHAATWVDQSTYRVRPDARRFENWESYVAGKVGLGAAVQYALDWGLDHIYRRVTNLATRLRAGLAELNGVTLRDLGEAPCGIVTFTVKDVHPEALKQALARRRINVSVSSRGSTRIDMTQRGIYDMIRASVHYYNTESELDEFCAALAEEIDTELG